VRRRPVDSRSVRARLTSDEGFGLIELLVAMVILNVALLAILAAFSSGAVATGRASKIGTATVLADQQMEIYRAMLYDPIGLDTSAAPTGAPYATDTTSPAACVTGGATTCSNAAPTSGWSCTATTGTTSVSAVYTTNGVNPCTPSRTVTGPDGRSYRVDTYIRAVAATTSQRATKIVTVVVRDGSKLTGRALAREASTFDCSTGQLPGAAPC
jgi:type II secretory pathway pseudopilin PulG